MFHVFQEIVDITLTMLRLEHEARCHVGNSTDCLLV